MDPNLLTYAQVAHALGLDEDTGRETIRAFVKAGHIKDVQVSPGVHRIHKDELLRIRTAMGAAP